MINLLQSLINLLCELYNNIIGLPALIWHKCIELITWYRHETFTIVTNFICDQFANLANLSPYTYTTDRQLLYEAFENVNLFVPLDDIIMLTINLFAAWLLVQWYRIAIKIAIAVFRGGKAPI